MSTNVLNFLLICRLDYIIKSVITVRTPGRGMFVDQSFIMQGSQSAVFAVITVSISWCAWRDCVNKGTYTPVAGLTDSYFCSRSSNSINGKQNPHVSSNTVSRAGAIFAH